MTICGIKLTHDGSIALLDDQRLVFCYEMEKLNNSPRYSPFNIGLQEVNSIFEEYGYSFGKADKIVIDGWTPEQPQYINFGAGNIPVELAGYGSLIVKSENVMQRKTFSLRGPVKIDYSSYFHVAGHITAAYCSSPMARRGEDSYVLVWDGGMFPQLFYYHSRTNEIENIGVLFMIIGNVYAIFSQYFGPFKVNAEDIDDNLSVAGKVMAYIAKGSYNKEIRDILNGLYEEHKDKGNAFAQILGQEFIRKTSSRDYPHETILCTFHEWLGQLLVGNLKEKMNKSGDRAKNLCFAGGSALNIKWNSAIRNAGLFKEVWVPPFPNDAGSSIGACCCEMIHSTGRNVLDWSVFAGPPVIDTMPEKGWERRPMSIDALALLLFLENQPVVFLNGRAELGPRALGNRSILAPATHAYMKRILNDIKGREDYRPVAPICMEDDAKEIFDPGTKDPYMLFDHLVRPEWKERIPAVCHLDGTARLQTVNGSENPAVYSLLNEYKKLSGIPLLCNTSANLSGRGFFPDALSAIRWGRVNYVWSDGFLYEKQEKVIFEASKVAAI